MPTKVLCLQRCFSPWGLEADFCYEEICVICTCFTEIIHHNLQARSFIFPWNNFVIQPWQLPVWLGVFWRLWADIDSFNHSIGMCRMQWLLAILRSFFHSSLLYTPSFHPFAPASVPSSLTSSCHLYLGLPLNLVASKFIYKGWIQSSGNTAVTWRMCIGWHYCRLYLIAEVQLK